jgi:sulfatase maturation enzyme AslB (radical SAM superfamily)
MCGNLGDPIIAQDCLEIFEHLREINPSIRLSMHTNGSARNVHWWKDLAKHKVKVTFGIDGLEDTHKLYRVDTDWHKIIKNAWTFIQAGGEAEWHMLVFKHNEHQIEECQKISNDMNFKKFTTKHTSRFKDGKFNVLDEFGKTVNILYPTEVSKTLTVNVLSIVPSVIQCKAQKYKQLYVAADGTVSPCCWLDMEWMPPQSFSRIDYMEKITEIKHLQNDSLQQIFDSGYFKKIQDDWSCNPLRECKKQCGEVDRFNEQFK